MRVSQVATPDREPTEAENRIALILKAKFDPTTVIVEDQSGLSVVNMQALADQWQEDVAQSTASLLCLVHSRVSLLCNNIGYISLFVIC